MEDIFLGSFEGEGEFPDDRGSITLYECDKCGAAVSNPDKHEQWHKLSRIGLSI